jgi:hypothetical protein
MKKTTWVIIGLSVLVVALSIALVIVITHKKTEPITSTEADFSYEPSNIINVMVAPKPWLRAFSISSDYTKSKIYFFGKYTVPYITPEPEKEVDFLGELVPGVLYKMESSYPPYKIYMAKKPYQTQEEKK